MVIGKTPNRIAPAGSSEGRDQLPVCDETPQNTMGFAWKARGQVMGQQFSF
jgi:hypothetical protein